MMIIPPRVRTGSGPLRATRFALLALLVFSSLALAVGAAPRGAMAQSSQSFHWPRYDANITVNKDGSLDVVENLLYSYDSGRFHRGNRSIPLGRLGSISNLSVAEVRNGQVVPYTETSYDPDDSTFGVPGTFGTITDGDQLKIRWVYDYVSAPDLRTFQLRYHVNDAVRVYNDHDEFDWYAIPQDASAPISSSQVQVAFPSGVDASKLVLASNPQTDATANGNTVVWSRNGGLDSGLE